MARVTVKPPEPLEIEFSDGTSKFATFNNEAFILYTYEYGPLNQAAFADMISKPYDFTAKVLHSGMMVHDRNVTLEEARNIIVSGGEDLLLEISRLMTENFLTGAEAQELDNKSVKAITSQAPPSTDQGIDNAFWETLYYSYCIKLSRPEVEFYNSTTAKVLRMLDIHTGGLTRKQPVEQVYSMRDFLK